LDKKSVTLSNDSNKFFNLIIFYPNHQKSKLSTIKMESLVLKLIQLIALQLFSEYLRIVFHPNQYLLF
jgi:hypothetical protein